MAASPKYADLSDSITSGLENIRKWYGKTDDTDAYFVCLGSQIFTLHGISTDILLQSLIRMSKLPMHRTDGLRPSSRMVCVRSRKW